MTNGDNDVEEQKNLRGGRSGGNRTNDGGSWKSCCFECDREVVLYSAKITFSMVTLVFGMYMILSNEDPCKDLAFPVSLVSMIAGSFVEQGQRAFTGVRPNDSSSQK
jgi:hypothetical protein